MSADEDRAVSALQEQEALWREQEERRQLLQMQIEQQRKVKNFQYLNQAARKGGVLFTGSSLMEGFPVCELCRSAGYELAVYNRGIGGYTTDDFLREIHTVLLDLEPSKVFLNIGTNDLRVWEDGSDWLEHLMGNYEKILQIARAHLPNTVFYLMAYYPVNAGVADEQTKSGMLAVRTNGNLKLANEQVSMLAEKYGCRYINVNEGLTDENGDLKAEFTIEGVHLYANAYRVVFENLKRYL